MPAIPDSCYPPAVRKHSCCRVATPRQDVDTPTRSPSRISVAGSPRAACEVMDSRRFHGAHLMAPRMQTSHVVSDPRFGPYEVVSPLASGGMGGVFLASHVRTGERVALKVVDPRFAD